MDNTAYDYFASENTMSIEEQKQSESLHQSKDTGTVSDGLPDESVTGAVKKTNKAQYMSIRINRKKVDPVRDLQRYKFLQVWNGVITEVDEENQSFQARLTDIDNSSNPDELVTLSIDEIYGVDIELVDVGSQFYWFIGYKDGFKKSRERISVINFRRLPKWSVGDLNMAKSITDEYMSYFNGNK